MSSMLAFASQATALQSSLCSHPESIRLFIEGIRKLLEKNGKESVIESTHLLAVLHFTLSNFPTQLDPNMIYFVHESLLEMAEFVVASPDVVQIWCGLVAFTSTAHPGKESSLAMFFRKTLISDKLEFQKLALETLAALLEWNFWMVAENTTTEISTLVQFCLSSMGASKDLSLQFLIVLVGLKTLCNPEKLGIVNEQKGFLESLGDLVALLDSLRQVLPALSVRFIAALTEILKKNPAVLKPRVALLFDAISELSFFSTLDEKIAALLFCEQYFEIMSGQVKKSFLSATNPVKLLLKSIFELGSELIQLETIRNFEVENITDESLCLSVCILAITNLVEICGKNALSYIFITYIEQSLQLDSFSPNSVYLVSSSACKYRNEFPLLVLAKILPLLDDFANAALTEFFGTVLRQCSRANETLACASLILLNSMFEYQGEDILNRNSIVTIAGVLCECLESQCTYVRIEAVKASTSFCNLLASRSEALQAQASNFIPLLVQCLCFEKRNLSPLSSDLHLRSLSLLIRIAMEQNIFTVDLAVFTCTFIMNTLELYKSISACISSACLVCVASVCSSIHLQNLLANDAPNFFAVLQEFIGKMMNVSFTGAWGLVLENCKLLFWLKLFHLPGISERFYNDMVLNSLLERCSQELVDDIVSFVHVVERNHIEAKGYEFILFNSMRGKCSFLRDQKLSLLFANLNQQAGLLFEFLPNSLYLFMIESAESFRGSGEISVNLMINPLNQNVHSCRSNLILKASLLCSFADFLELLRNDVQNAQFLEQLVTFLVLKLLPLLDTGNKQLQFPELFCRCVISLTISCVETVCKQNLMGLFSTVVTMLPLALNWIKCLPIMPIAESNNDVVDRFHRLLIENSRIFFNAEVHVDTIAGYLNEIADVLLTDYDTTINEVNATEFESFLKDRLLALASLYIAVASLNAAYFESYISTHLYFFVTVCTARRASVRVAGFRILSSLVPSLGNCISVMGQQVLALLIAASSDSSPSLRQYAIVGLGNLALHPNKLLIRDYVADVMSELQTHTSATEKVNYPFVYDHAIVASLKFVVHFGSSEDDSCSVFYMILSSLPLRFEVALNQEVVALLVEILVNGGSKNHYLLGSMYMNLPKVLDVCFSFFASQIPTSDLLEICVQALRQLPNQDALIQAAKFVNPSSIGVPLLTNLGLKY